MKIGICIILIALTLLAMLYIALQNNVDKKQKLRKQLSCNHDFKYIQNVWGHEGDVCGPVSDTFLIDYHLLAGDLLEHVQLIFLLSGQTAGCIFHIIFQKFRQGIVDNDNRLYKRIDESDLLRFRIILVVVVFIPECIDPVYCILDVSQTEESPVIGLYRHIGTM